METLFFLVNSQRTTDLEQYFVIMYFDASFLLTFSDRNRKKLVSSRKIYHYEQGLGKPFKKPNKWRDAVYGRDRSLRHSLLSVEHHGGKSNKFF